VLFVVPNRISLGIALCQGSLRDVSIIANHLHHTDRAFLWTFLLLLLFITWWLLLQKSNRHYINIDPSP
jgi:hypothetical protein